MSLNGERKYTLVYLQPSLEKEDRVFRCVTCGSFILGYTQHVAWILPTDKATVRDVVSSPFTIYCRGDHPARGKCPEVYVFEGFVN